jgi:ArsR family transcriptional regulator
MSTSTRHGREQTLNTTTSPVMPRPRATKPPPKTPAITISESILRGLVEVFQMLADQSRLRILLTLARSGEMHVTALCELLGQSQPAVSHHLSLLRTRRLVSVRRDGKNNFYSVDSTLVRDLLDQFFDDAGNAQRQLQLDGFSLAFKSR